MALINIYNFGGEMPRVDPKLLKDNYATKANNVELRRGQLAPVRTPLAISQAVPTDTESIYHFNKDGNSGAGFWFSFDGDADVVRGPIANDTELRTYFTGDGVPKYTHATIATAGVGPYPSASYDLGLPVPSTITAAGSTGEIPEGGQEISTSYVTTFVTDKGEEGPPSDSSNIVVRWDSASVSLSGFTPPTGNYNITHTRIYRVELTGEYFMVAEIPISATTYLDEVDSDGLLRILPSTDWSAPHPDMKGLIALPNGVLMGFWGNTIGFSEPYIPHAWPTGYQLALDYDVIGAAVSASGIIVVTTGSPYLIVGSHPQAMSQTKLDVVQAGSSKRSVVDMGPYVVYASADGLVAAGGTQASVVTESIILPEQWRQRVKPESIHAYRYEDRYLGFYDNGTESGAFSYKPEEGFRFYDEHCDCAYVDDESGDLVIKQGTELKKWEAGAYSTFDWQSKLWVVPGGEAVCCGKVDADYYPVTLEFMVDGATLSTLEITSNRPFRLPAKPWARTMQIAVSGSNPVSNIQLATSMSELV
ncbi:MAG: hypothetical protein ACRBBW_20825 [Cellvibrionaceae bacterium]